MERTALIVICLIGIAAWLLIVGVIGLIVLLLAG